MRKLSLTRQAANTKNIKIRKADNIMKTGRITAKLRDAVPVCLMVEGKEVKRYKNIELPDSIKEVELLDFHFNIPADGKITFEIHYASGVLPEIFPEPRAKVTRAEKAAAKVQRKAAQEEAAEAPAPVYQKAPTYAFAIGSYIIDRNGKLSGEKNEELTEALAAQGFTAA